MKTFDLSEVQAKAILDMRLMKLTGLEREKVQQEYDELQNKISHLKSVLDSKDMRMSIIKEELEEVREKYDDPRRTEIALDDSEISIEDIIENEQVVVNVSRLGYIKRTALDEYREQGRGGKGSRGGSTRQEDFIEEVFIASTHNYILFFSEGGKCYWLKVYQIPEGSKTSKGRPLQNLIQLPKDDKIVAYTSVKNLKDDDFLDSHFVVFCTKKGLIKKTSMRDFSRPRSNGIIAISIKDGDQLLEAKLTDGNSDILIAGQSGKSVRFPEAKVRAMGRSAAGVRGIKLNGPEDEAVGMITVMGDEKDSHTILVVSENGFGKRSKLDEYRLTNRGGKGVKTLNVTDKTGQLITIKAVEDKDGLIIINKSGITIRMSVNDISVIGRATQGVRLIKLKDEDQIASVAKIPAEDEEAAAPNAAADDSKAGDEEE